MNRDLVLRWNDVTIYRITALRAHIKHQTSNLEPQTSEVMNIKTLRIGMKVRHPHGVGVVKSLTEQTAEITFDDAQRTIAPASSDLQSAEPTATLSELNAACESDPRYCSRCGRGSWAGTKGRARRRSGDSMAERDADYAACGQFASVEGSPARDILHKIVMIRNNLRVLEQKVNASDKLSDADKFELQQYITRCYGSLTTFNILFKSKDDQFRTGL